MGQQSKLRGFRYLVGLLKDKASLSKAALLSKPDKLALHLAVLRATTHDPSSPPREDQVTALLSSGHSSRLTASTCIEALMDRLHNTHNSAVALKCLITIHNIIRRGTFILQDQLSIYPSAGGRNYLNLSNFRDDVSPETWELSSWVRWYARVLEQLLFTSRVLGFFLSSLSPFCTREEDVEVDKLSALLNSDLVKEIDALVGAIEEICRAPDSLHVQGNRLVYEVKTLVGEDYRLAQREILVRVNELKERLTCMSFGDSVELVCILKRLENCKERLSLLFLNKKNTTGDSLWDSIGDVKERIETVVDDGERRLIRVEKKGKESESARFGNRVVRSGESIRFSSGRFVLDRVPLPILE